MSKETCIYCAGHGKRHNGYFEYPCNHCRGTGEVRKNRFSEFIPLPNKTNKLNEQK